MTIDTLANIITAAIFLTPAVLLGKLAITKVLRWRRTRRAIKARLQEVAELTAVVRPY